MQTPNGENNVRDFNTASRKRDKRRDMLLRGLIEKGEEYGQQKECKVGNVAFSWP